MVAEVPNDLVVEETLPIIEKNGFVIADFTPETIRISFYSWKPPAQTESIDELEPFHVLELKLPLST